MMQARVVREMHDDKERMILEERDSKQTQGSYGKQSQGCYVVDLVEDSVTGNSKYRPSQEWLLLHEDKEGSYFKQTQESCIVNFVEDLVTMVQDSYEVDLVEEELRL